MFFNISSQAELAEMPLAEDVTSEETYQSEDDTACIDDEGNEVACDDEVDDVSADVDDGETEADVSDTSDDVDNSDTEKLQVESACDDTEEDCTF